MKNEIIPVILAQNLVDFQNKLKTINALKPKPKMIQIDIVDGEFAPFKTFHDYKKIKKLKLPPFEIHLMVTDPMAYARKWIKAGAKRILFHVEKKSIKYRVLSIEYKNILKTIHYIKAQGVEVGLCLNPDTPIDVLNQFLDRNPSQPPLSSRGGSALGGNLRGGDAVDCVLLLGVNPGRSGQSFQSQTLKKITALRRLCPALPIEVDGGVKLDNALAIFKAGANRLSVASAVINAKNPQKAYQQLLKVN